MLHINRMKNSIQRLVYWLLALRIDGVKNTFVYSWPQFERVVPLPKRLRLRTHRSDPDAITALEAVTSLHRR